MSSNFTAVIGLQWGDEGKGKIVDTLAIDTISQAVVRFQGGPNAGHTLMTQGQKTILHQIPSGILKSCFCAISSGVVLDLDILHQEIEALGDLVTPKKFGIDYSANVIMPYHRDLDGAREEALSESIGTTKKGIGPCYEDKTARRGIRLGYLSDVEVLSKVLRQVLPEKNALLQYYGLPTYEVDELVDEYRDKYLKIQDYVMSVDNLIQRVSAKGCPILLEGAQGTLLDVNLGSYPFVTSSSTITASGCTALGIGPQEIKRVVGVVKAYTTRVGGGPMITECEDASGTHMQSVGKEFGSTTGRPRRCGWIDIPALKYAIRVNGVTEIALTKLDVLSGLEYIRVCEYYRHKDSGHTSERYLRFAEDYREFEPCYMQVFQGWKEDLTNLSKFDQLPQNAQKYVEFLEKELNTPITMIGVGPNRHQILNR